jgi:hypothetical protein
MYQHTPLINKIKKVTVYSNKYASPTLALVDDLELYYVVAAASRHVGYDWITCPAREDHRHDWLADVRWGYALPTSGILHDTVAAWLASADLSPLAVDDDIPGHKRLIASLTAAIDAARTTMGGSCASS